MTTIYFNQLKRKQVILIKTDAGDLFSAIAENIVAFLKAPSQHSCFALLCTVTVQSLYHFSQVP